MPHPDLIPGPYGWRCPSCGCGVTDDHVPDSEECHQAYTERIQSQRDDD